MGKAKKRNLHNRQNGLTTMSREQAVKEIISRIKAVDFGPQTKDIIGLFGINAEELAAYLSSEYEIDQVVALRDVERQLEEWEKFGLTV